MYPANLPIDLTLEFSLLWMFVFPLDALSLRPAGSIAVPRLAVLGAANLPFLIGGLFLPGDTERNPLGMRGNNHVFQPVDQL